MRFLAILFLFFLSAIWYYISFLLLNQNMLYVLFNGEIALNNNLIILILLAGMFVFGILFGKLLDYKKNIFRKKIVENKEKGKSILSKIKEYHSSKLIYFKKYRKIKKINGISREEVDKINLIYKSNKDIDFTIVKTKKEKLKNNSPKNSFLDLNKEDYLSINKKIKKDNLTIIEGIGPKIEKLLNKGGIFSYMDLASSSTLRVKNILQKEGTRYILHNPVTWSKQASFLVEGNLIKLKEYQKKLVKGVEKK